MLLRFNGEKKFWGFLESSIVAAMLLLMVAISIIDGGLLLLPWWLLSLLVKKGSIISQCLRNGLGNKYVNMCCQVYLFLL